MILCLGLSLGAGNTQEKEALLVDIPSRVDGLIAMADAEGAINISKSGGSNENPLIVTRNNGTAYVIWVNYGSGKSIQFNTNESGSWGTPYSVSAGTYVSASGPWPYFAIDTQGHPHLVFTTKFSGDNYEISHNSYAGQWTGNTNVSQTYEGGSACPTIAVNPTNNQRYVCWYDDEGHPDRWELFFKYQSTGGGWSGLKRLPFAMSLYTPKMAVDGQGRAHLIWLRRHSGGSFVTYSSNPNPTDEYQWSGETTVSGNTNIDFAEISIAADHAGNVFVVYEKKNSGNYEIYFQKKSVGGGWSSAENISKTGGSSRWPDVAADSSGNAYVVWQENRGGKYQIYFRYYGNGHWTETLDLTNNGSDSIQPSIWVDGAGEVHVVYADKSTGNYNIFYLSTTETGDPIASVIYPPLNVRLATNLESELGQKKNIVRWKKNQQNDSENIDCRKLYRKQVSQGVSAYSLRAKLDKNVYRYEDTNLSTNYKYSYVLTTVSKDGEESEYSNEAEEALVFPPVDLSLNSDLDGTGTKKINTLAWKRNSHNGSATVQKYKIYRRIQDAESFVNIGSVSGSAYSYKDNNLPTGKKYVYRITAADKSGKECEPSLSQYEDYVFYPINLTLKTAVNVGLFYSEKINLFKWKHSPLNNPVNVVKYVVYRGKADEDESAYAPLTVVTAETKEFWDRNLPLDEKYGYAATAVCDNGAESKLSNSRVEK